MATRIAWHDAQRLDHYYDEKANERMVRLEDESTSEVDRLSGELASAIKSARNLITRRNDLMAKIRISEAVRLSNDLDRRRLMLDEAIVRRDMIDARAAWVQSAIDASPSTLQVLARVEPAASPDGPHVYFMAEDSAEFMKIGWTSGGSDRISAHQVSNPRRLVLVACLPGARELEKRCHKAFATERARGEWFRISRRLAAFALEAREGNDVSWFFEAQCA